MRSQEAASHRKRRSRDPRSPWRLSTIFAVLALVALTAASVNAADALERAAAQEHSQSIQGRRLDDIYIVARFNDGYWGWYWGYLEQREGQRQRVSEIRIQLSVIAAHSKKLRANWLKLLYLENQLTPTSQYDPGWAPYWQAFLGVSSVGELSGEARREIDDVAFRWSAGIFGQPLRPVAAAGARIDRQYQQQRAGLRTQINRWKDTQRVLIDEALAATAALSESTEAQENKSGGRRPWLADEIQRLTDEATLLRIQLYDAAEWYLPNELPALIRELDVDSTATEEVARLMRAKVHLARASDDDEKIWLQMASPRQSPPDPVLTIAARTARLDAIVELRRVLQISPENAEARGLLVELELFWLRQIAAKIGFERRANLEAFRGYLTDRGFYTDQPAGWTEYLWEFAAAVWGLGPIASAAGLPGIDVPGSLATELDVTQQQAAKHQVTMLAIIRLVKNGVPLTEIRALTADEIAERMTLHTVDGRRLPADKARRIALDIRDTFSELDDLRRLASTDGEYLVEDVNMAFRAGYYAPLAASYTWYETFGDILNVHNIAFLWGPGSVAKINEQWVGLRYLSSTEIQAAEQAGKLVTGKQAFIARFGLDTIAETFAATGVGARWANAMAADQAARQGLSLLSLPVDLGARLTAAMILYSGGGYLAEQAGLPAAQILVELLGEIGPSELLSDVVARAGTPIERVAARVDEFGEFLARRQADLAARQALIDGLNDLITEAGETVLTQSRVADFNTRLALIADRLDGLATARMPGSPADGVDHALAAATNAMRAGDQAEAARAITGAIKAAEDVGEELSELYGVLARARRALNTARQEPPPLRILTADEPRTIDQLTDDGPPTKFWRPDLYADEGPGASIRAGDEAIREGDLETAAEHFRAARHEAFTRGEMARYSRELNYAEDQLGKVVNAQRTGQQIDDLLEAVPLPLAADDLSPTQIDEVLANFDEAISQGTGPSLRSTNPVYRIQDADGNEYYVKRIVSDPDNPMSANLTPEEAERLMASEAAGASLAQRVGLNAPTTHFDPERQLLISRAIPNEGDLAGPLWDYPEHVALAFRQEYAKQRLFRAWLGDGDGHLGNLIIGRDGRLYLIDFDQAVLSGTRSRQFPDDTLPSEEGLMQTLLYTPAALTSDAEQLRKYRWMAKLDQQITYDDVQDTVAAIQDLANNNADELRRMLEDAGYPDVDGAVRSLTERANKLEEVFEPMFNGGLLEVASLPPNDLRLAA